MSLTCDTYVYDGAVTLVPEIDGLRIISSTSHELLHRVPGNLLPCYIEPSGRVRPLATYYLVTLCRQVEYDL